MVDQNIKIKASWLNASQTLQTKLRLYIQEKPTGWPPKKEVNQHHQNRVSWLNPLRYSQAILKKNNKEMSQHSIIVFHRRNALRLTDCFLEVRYAKIILFK